MYNLHRRFRSFLGDWDSGLCQKGVPKALRWHDTLQNRDITFSQTHQTWSMVGHPTWIFSREWIRRVRNGCFCQNHRPFCAKEFKISTENSPRSHSCCGRITLVLFMTLLEGEDLHIKIHQWWHDIRFHEKNSHRFYLQHVQPTGRTYVVQQHNLIIIWHSIPEAAMNQSHRKPWVFQALTGLDPRWSVGGHQQTTNLSKGVTFQPSWKRARSQNCQVKVFFHHLFFWNELFIFLLYVRIRYSFSDLKVFDKSLFYGVLLQKKLLFGDLEVLRSMLQCKSSRRFSIHEKHYNSIHLFRITWV